jgi:hypothetical protein
VVTKRRDGDGRPVRHSFGGGGYGEKQIGKLEKKARPNRYAKRCGRGNEGHEEETKFGIRSRLEGEITVLKFIFVASSFVPPWRDYGAASFGVWKRAEVAEERRGNQN